MSTPLGILGAALLFWGLQTGLLLPAALLALTIEGSRLVRRRWDLSLEDFIRVTDGVTLLFAGSIAYAYATRPMTLAVMAVVSWFPLCFAPILLIQTLSTRGTFSISVLFLSLRRRARQGESFAEVRLGWPFFMACLLGASAANVRTPAFYFGMFVLSAWAFLSLRPRGARPWAASALLLASGLLGFVSQDGLHRLQGAVEKAGAELIFGIVELGSDPYQTRTAIGSIGSLLQSDLILARVRTEPGTPGAGRPLSRSGGSGTPEPGTPGAGSPPELLRRAVYGSYRAGAWLAADRTMTPLKASGDGRTWALAPEPPGQARSLTVSFSLTRGKGLLALPPGAFRAERLLAGSVTRGGFGTVSVDEGPGLVSYRAVFSSSPAGADAPSAADLVIPADEEALMAGLARDLGLDRRRPAEALAKVSRFFEEGFTYSTYQEGGKHGERPLERFLLRTRSGHCEYFATATVLLLRAAGIPARYCVGWSIQEYSRLERAFIVRQRHGHAWALAHDGTAWQDFDTTPATWASVESERAPWWGPVRDLWSWARFQVSRWRWEPKEEGRTSPLLWLGLALLLALAGWKGSRLLSAARSAQASTAKTPSQGLDSEFYLVESALSRRGWGRRPAETWKDWLCRVETEAGVDAEDLRPVAALHERHRFDPPGLSPEGR
ncbi:MAG: transglutaminase domain-containing protein, partial [Elusimicrobiota bacterium]